MECNVILERHTERSLLMSVLGVIALILERHTDRKCAPSRYVVLSLERHTERSLLMSFFAVIALNLKLERQTFFN